MLMLESLVAWEPGRAECRMTVADDTPFVGDGRVDALMTMEYMAQAVAACLGYEAFRGGVGVRVGMIIACRAMDLEVSHIAVGAELTVRVRCVRGNETLSHFDCEVHEGDARLASATMTLIHAEQPPADQRP
jgi:predicted hotdog family 3-hydroxylacyl-ACP dehydratase